MRPRPQRQMSRRQGQSRRPRAIGVKNKLRATPVGIVIDLRRWWRQDVRAQAWSAATTIYETAPACRVRQWWVGIVVPVRADR